MNSKAVSFSDVHQITFQSWPDLFFPTQNTEESINQLAEESAFSAKPFIKWIGGKGRFAKEFHKFYPKTFDPEKNIYYEPFLGGGAIFFDLKPRQAVISDANEELITTYRVIRDNPDLLISSLKKHKNTKKYFYWLRGQHKEKLQNDVEIASRFIYLNRTSFNGMYRVNRRGEFNVPYGFYKNPCICDEENLKNVHSLLQNVKMEYGDYRKILRNVKKGDFVYLDPPYSPLNKRTANFTKYTKDSFTDEDQINVRDTFIKLHKKGCFVMISNSNVPFIRKIFSKSRVGFDFRVKVVYTRHLVASRGHQRKKVEEIVIMNY